MLFADPAQPFDFLIDGELLRQPLEKFLLAHNVSTVQSSLLFFIACAYRARAAPKVI